MLKEKLELFVKTGFCRTIELLPWDIASRTAFADFEKSAARAALPRPEAR
jgi:hypothetical protein